MAGLGHGASFGERLRQLRESAGLTQEELAERAGLSVQAVGSLERGDRQRPYPQTVRALADALGLGDAERATLTTTLPRCDTGADAAPRRPPRPTRQRPSPRPRLRPLPPRCASRQRQPR